MTAAWWESAAGGDDPPPTHVVEFRLVLRVRVAVVPDADAEAVAADAAARWAAALHGYGPGGERDEAEFWGAGAGPDAVVLGVEVAAADASVRPEGR